MSQTNYYDSTLLGHQSRVMPKYNEAELRELENGVLAKGLANQQYLMDVAQIETIKQTPQRPVYGYQFVKKPSTSGTAFTAFHTGIQGATQQVPLTWVPFTESFFTNGTTGMDNVMNIQAIWDNEMKQAQRNLRERIRIYLTGLLHTNRTQVNGAGAVKNAVWNAATNSYEINDPQKIWANITSVMHQNKYQYSNYDVFADSALFPNWNFTIAQGVNNGINLGYQSQKFSNVWEDIILGNQVATEYGTGLALVLPQNAFTFIPWLPKLYLDGGGEFESYAGGYGTVGDDSGIDMTYGVHGWKTQADTSGSNGYTQDTVMQWEIGVYVAFQQAVISNANESPIYQFALVP